MDPSDVLIQEHQVIRQVLLCYEKILSKCRLEGKPESENTKKVFSFLKNYFHILHEGKEEHLLFPLLAQKGFAQESTLTGDILHDYKESIDILKEVEIIFPTALEGVPAGVKSFIDSSKKYINLVRKLIRKKEHYILPITEVALSGTEEKKLLQDFKDWDEKVEVEQRKEEYVEKAVELAKNLGIPTYGF